MRIKYEQIIYKLTVIILTHDKERLNKKLI